MVPRGQGAQALLAVLLTTGFVGGAGGCGQPEAPPGPAAASGEPWVAADPRGRVLATRILQREGEIPRLVLVHQDSNGERILSTVARGPSLFVNWADTPSVLPAAGGRIWAHWLERQGEPGHAYGIRVAWSDDGGRGWSAPVVPHRDSSPTEHGFASLAPCPPGEGPGIGVAWLDGRALASGPPDSPASEEDERATALYFARLDGEGRLGPEEVVDPRVCDCCNTDLVATPTGWLVAYRDRSPEEVRDISVRRRGPQGWSEAVPVAREGWRIQGCPVNGPAVDVAQGRVAVAWYTHAGGEGMVRTAFEGEGGFGPAWEVSGQDPLGRVDLVLLRPDLAAVLWMEQVGEEAEVRLARVRKGRGRDRVVTLGRTGAGRPSGFPRMARAGGRLVVQWTDTRSRPHRVTSAVLPLAGWL